MVSAIAVSPMLGNPIADKANAQDAAAAFAGPAASLAAAVNSAPVADGRQAFATLPGVSLELTVRASDSNRDPLSFTASNPGHGTVSGGNRGTFVYTPDPAFTGTDSFDVTVSDGKGGTAVQAVTVTTAALPASNDWRLFAEAGWLGEIGGNGRVFGTAGQQEIAVFNVPGHVQFDASFNAGGDLVSPGGLAADWMVFRQGANAVLTDGDTFLTIPAGTAGLALLFDDGARLLTIDSSRTMRIGGQVIDGTLRPVTAAPDGSGHAPDVADSALGKLFLAESGHAWVGGNLEVFGTNGREQVSVQHGTVLLDASFARGGDLLHLPADFEHTSVQRLGSNVSFMASAEDISVSLTAGTHGLTIVFANGTRTLAFDPVLDTISLGGQIINNAAAMMTFA